MCCFPSLSSHHITSLLFSSLFHDCAVAFDFAFALAWEKSFFYIHDDSNLSIRWVSYKQYIVLCANVCVSVSLKSHTIKMKITLVRCSILLECPDKNYIYTHQLSRKRRMREKNEEKLIPHSRSWMVACIFYSFFSGDIGNGRLFALYDHSAWARIRYLQIQKSIKIKIGFQFSLSLSFVRPVSPLLCWSWNGKRIISNLFHIFRMGTNDKRSEVFFSYFFSAARPQNIQIQPFVTATIAFFLFHFFQLKFDPFFLLLLSFVPSLARVDWQPILNWNV